MKVGREIPVAGKPSGNYRPEKYSQFGQSGKYEILELFWLKYLLDSYKFKLKAHISYHLCIHHENKVINFMTGQCPRTQEMILGFKGFSLKQNCFLGSDYINNRLPNHFLSFSSLFQHCISKHLHYLEISSHTKVYRVADLLKPFC